VWLSPAPTTTRTRRWDTAPHPRPRPSAARPNTHASPIPAHTSSLCAAMQHAPAPALHHTHTPHHHPAPHAAAPLSPPAWTYRHPHPSRPHPRIPAGLGRGDKREPAAGHRVPSGSASSCLVPSGTDRALTQRGKATVRNQGMHTPRNTKLSAINPPTRLAQGGGHKGNLTEESEKQTTSPQFNPRFAIQLLLEIMHFSFFFFFLGEGGTHTPNTRLPSRVNEKPFGC